MLAQFGANVAAVGSVAAMLFRRRFGMTAAIAASALALAGCVRTTEPLAGSNPADSAAGVAGVGYRSTVAPYTGLRPAAPSSWREQNERVAPATEPTGSSR